MITPKLSQPGQKLLFLFFSLLFSFGSKAYTIKGTLSHSNCFYPRVYLAVINNINGIYSSSYQDIISSAALDSNGSFTITGNDLPSSQHFYRLYLTDNEQTNVAIYVGKKRNYILGDAMCSLQNILLQYDSVRWSTPGASKLQFSKSKRYTDLRHFADTCTYLLAGLWAVTEMGIDSNYNNDAPFFRSFANRFTKAGISPDYATQLNEKLDTVGYKTDVHVPLPLFVMVSLLLGCSVVVNIYQALQKKRSEEIHPVVLEQSNEEEKIRALIETLTIKEREILRMIHEGLSNKEIAALLHIEVSTVKTHVSSIYQKTGISNRKEVAGIARYL